jgi:hypothetical protein
MPFDSIQLRAALDRVNLLQGDMAQRGFGSQPMRCVLNSARIVATR